MTTTRKPAAAQAAQQLATPQLQHWIAEHLRVGTPIPDIIDGMVQAGWQTATATRALADAQAGRLALEKASQIEPALALPEPDLGDGRTRLVVEGHEIKVSVALRHPRVVVFEGLLTAQECAALVEQSRPRLSRSETVDNSNGGSEVNAARTSDGMFFTRGETTLIARIESRIAALLRWPASHGEGLQILRYRPGAEYQPHHDYFDPAHPGSATILQRGGQRVATMVMYLVEPRRGGATTFPSIGIEVAPVAGNAVFFSYDRPHPATGTLHGGAPVLEGEKWVATKWLRQGEFR